MMDIDPTEMLYALVRADCSIRDVLRDYFVCDCIRFSADCGYGLDLPITELLALLINGTMPSGMARLPRGFLYVLDDSSAVVGFDGDSLNPALQKRILEDDRFEATFAWGDQPPPETRTEILRFASVDSQ